VIRAAGLSLQAVIVNEDEPGPGLRQAAEEIANRLPGVGVATLVRGGDGAALLPYLGM
jgi:hypothetical protein